jgi:hypothetical protein
MRLSKNDRFYSFIESSSTTDELRSGSNIFQEQEIQDFLHTEQNRDFRLREISPLFLRADPFHVGVMALVCGTLVEQGGDATILCNTVLDATYHQLQQIKTFHDVHGHVPTLDFFDSDPSATRAHFSLPYILFAAMTMICRDKETRKQWQSNTNLLTLAYEFVSIYEALSYVIDVLSLLDDKELLILDPIHTRGFLTKLVGVQDRIYHCYALLQHAILEQTGPDYLHAELTDAKAVRYAKNDHLSEDDFRNSSHLSDHQRFAFYYPSAWEPDNQDAPLHLGLFFPGSANFSEIPIYNGMPILLIGEKTMTISWQPSNMYPIIHEALQSQVVIVRELSPDETESWLQIIHH